MVILGVSTAVGLFQKLKKEIEESKDKLERARFKDMAEDIKRYVSVLDTAVEKLNKMTTAQINYNNAVKGLD